MTIRFPAILHLPGDSFHVEDSLPIHGTAESLRRGYFLQAELFDSAGQLWKVREAHAGSATGRRLFGRPLINIDLVLAAPQDGHQTRLVNALCALVDADPDDLYSQWVTHEELKDLFRRADTPEALVIAARDLGAG